MNIEQIRSNIRNTLESNKKEKEKEHSNRSLQKANKYYGSKYWKTLRNRYIAEHPICENCYEYGLITPAEEVHHIVPFYRGANEREMWKLLLDESNLKSLCCDCHKEIHRLMATDPEATKATPKKIREKLYDEI